MSEPTAPSRIRPIFLTLVGLCSVAGIVAMPFLAGQPVEGALPQWQRFIGRFHPVFLHLPIGMLALVLFLELGGLFRKGPRQPGVVPAFLMAASAMVAAICGFLLWQSNPGEYPEDLIERHLWWGTGFAAMMGVAFIIKAWVDFAGGAGNWLYVLTLVASGGVMGVASHDGGSITHGKTYLIDEAPNGVRGIYNRFVPEDERVKMLEAEDEAAEDVPVVPLEEQVVYTSLVQPIFDQKCVSCHGPDKKQGKLRMDSYEELLKGGKEGDAFEPGNAEDSNILYRIHLPLDDEEHMPPDGKKQMEEHEIEIITWWIEQGAKPDSKAGEMELTDAIREAAGKLVSPAELKRQAEALAAAEAEKEKNRKEIAAKVEEVRKEFPTALQFESQESDGLVFNAVSMRADFGDDRLGKLTPVAGALVSMDLSATQVTDSGLAVLREAGRLRQLRLAETAVTDAGLEHLAGLVELESLNLYGTKVTKAGVEKLKGLPKLRKLFLWQTGVDEAAAAELRKAMPDCEIVLGVAAPAP